MTKPNGQRVLITAGAGGIGRAIALAFASAGARVHACDIDAAGLSELRANGSGITTSVCDVADRGAVQRMTWAGWTCW
jgi:NAD(P)-dependent dehydrogenase (short-subunit alcohol dehydrogenase family)